MAKRDSKVSISIDGKERGIASKSQPSSIALTKSTMSDLEDAELVNRVLRGEKAYFNEIVNRYETSIYQYMFRMCGNQADAEDVLQETFLNAFRALDSFRGDSKLSTWLYKIANNSCLMKRRKSKFAPDKELSLTETSTHSEIESGVSIHTPAKTPIDAMLSSEFRSILQNILLDLPKHYRQTFILADIQGFRGQEISDILGVTIPTVKSRLHRARIFIRERLSNYVDIRSEL